MASLGTWSALLTLTRSCTVQVSEIKNPFPHAHLSHVVVVTMNIIYITITYTVNGYINCQHRNLISYSKNTQSTSAVEFR